MISKIFKKKAQSEYDNYSDFVVDHKSEPIPDTLKIRYATLCDSESIASLVSSNNLDESLTLEFFINRTKQELSSGGNRQGFHIVVAVVNDEVIGYARSILYRAEVVRRYEHPAPAGWYLMGLQVHPDYRGKGIGRELTKFRINHISQVAKTIYYVVNKRNRSSIGLHESLGFKHVKDAPGFLRINFKDGLGCLYELSK